MFRSVDDERGPCSISSVWSTEAFLSMRERLAAVLGLYKKPLERTLELTRRQLKRADHDG